MSDSLGFVDFYSSWPLELMRPTIYSRQVWTERLLTYAVWEEQTFDSFEEGVLFAKGNIRTQSERLNSLYSYMDRLKISSEQDKMYETRIRKYKKRVKRIEVENININVNIKICTELIKAYPKLRNSTTDYLDSFSVPLPTPLLKKDAWVKYEKIRIKDSIDRVKLVLTHLKERLSKKISFYNELKGEIEKK